MSRLINGENRSVIVGVGIDEAVPDGSIARLFLHGESAGGIRADPTAYFSIRHLRRLLIAYEELLSGNTTAAYVAVRELDHDGGGDTQTVLMLQSSLNATQAVALAPRRDGCEDA